MPRSCWGSASWAEEGIAEWGQRFELVGVPVDDRRSVGIVDELRELRACGFVLVVVHEEVGVREEFGAGGEELAVVRVDVADGQEPWGIGGLGVLQVGDGLVGSVGIVVERRVVDEVAVGFLQVGSGRVRVGCSSRIHPGRCRWAVGD